MADGVGRDVTIPIAQYGIVIVTSLGEGVSVSFCFVEKTLLCSSERYSASYL